MSCMEVLENAEITREIRHILPVSEHVFMTKWTALLLYRNHMCKIYSYVY